MGKGSKKEKWGLGMGEERYCSWVGKKRNGEKKICLFIDFFFSFKFSIYALLTCEITRLFHLDY